MTPPGADRFRPYIEIASFLVVVAVTSVAAWFLPGKYHVMAVVGLLGIGILFDLLSAFYHLMTILTGKFMSGFPVVGLVFYVWFLMASRFSLVGGSQSDPGSLLLYKLADAAILFGFHALCQSPMFLQKPRSNYK